jgi:hypothetical protein
VSSPDKRSIIVRVEVEIPGECPPTTYVEGKPSQRLTEIHLPKGGLTPASVRVSGGVGYICATGNSTKDGTAARTVFAKIYPTGTTVFDTNPPPGTAAAIPAANGDWIFSGAQDLWPAANNALGTAANILYTWADYGTGAYEKTKWPFNGKTSTGTDCIPGSGSGSTSYKFPREWRVIGEGFGGEASVFNIACLLRIQKDSRGHPVWTNGGNGETSPSIELRHVADIKAWHLDFRYRELGFCYACPSASWNPLNANTLELEDYKTGAEEAPRSLQITPV